AAVGGNHNAFAVALGDGDGTFQAVQTFAASGGVGAIATADFNGDGMPDVATTSTWSPGSVDVMMNTYPVPPPATHFGLAAPATAAAGASFSVTVTALAATGSTDLRYRGTVHFTSSDSLAGLPAD